MIYVEPRRLHPNPANFFVASFTRSNFCCLTLFVFLSFSVFVSILDFRHGRLLCSAGEPGVSILKSCLK